MAGQHDIMYGIDVYKPRKQRLVVVCRKCQAMEVLPLCNVKRSDRAIQGVVDRLAEQMSPCQ